MAWLNPNPRRWQQKLNFRFEMIPHLSKCGRTPFLASRSLQNLQNAQSPYEEKKELKTPENAKLRKPAKSPKKEDIALVFGTKAEPGRVEILLPLRTVSEANCFEAWRNKHKRHKDQKRAVMFAMIPIKEAIRLPCTIRITRLAPKGLDAHDNLRMAVKYILDQTCAEIMNDFRPGRADGSDQLTFEYAQEKSKVYAVKIEILF